MTPPRIPFNRPQLAGGEHLYIDEALRSGKLSGNGLFTRRCTEWLEARIGCAKALLTPSCTAALEMCGILAGLEPKDEVIVPDFTFVSTANAFALRGAVPVFVDVDPRTLNMDAGLVEAAVTERTRAIVAVHYGGVACDMPRITAIAERRGLVVIEDAAHSLDSSLDQRPLGSFGALATLSFHETKNVHCGEGGALLINDPELVRRAEVAQEKGTDRSSFFRGEVDKYTWQGLGSSYLLSEVSAAFLWAQVERADEITAARRAIWRYYHQELGPLEEEGLLTRPVVPPGHVHGGHLYYILLPSPEARTAMLRGLGARGIGAVFHYVPLHDSPGGRQLGRASGSLAVSTDVSARLVRLPLWRGLDEAATKAVVDAVRDVATGSAGGDPGYAEPGRKPRSPIARRLGPR